jgi:hypothetical protein
VTRADCAFLGLLAAGCAGALAPLDQQPDFGQYFTLDLQGSTEQAKLDGTRLHGADLDVSRVSEGFRGSGPSGVIDLHAAGNRIVGSVGAGSTDLVVDGSDGDLRIRGRFADALGDLAVQSDEIKGTVGRCQYDLHRASPRGPWYEGQRACRGRLTGARVALPAALAALSPVQRGALLAIFLASERAPRPQATFGEPAGDPRAHHRTPGDMSVGSAAPSTSRP